MDILTKGDLRTLLDEVEGDKARGVLKISRAVLDVYGIYYANCAESPAKDKIVLPGFGPEAVRLDERKASQCFKSFCQSQFGQRAKLRLPFRFMFLEDIVVTLVQVDSASLSLTYRLLSGEEKVWKWSGDADVRALCLHHVTHPTGHLLRFVTESAEVLDSSIPLTDLARKVALAFFNCPEAEEYEASADKAEECNWWYGDDYMILRPGDKVLERSKIMFLQSLKV